MSSGQRCQGRGHLQLYPGEDLQAIDAAFEDQEEDLKDKIHARLQSRCETDNITGCWVYTGSWDSVNGQAKMRVGSKVYTVTRIAAWVYGVKYADGTPAENFSLFDTRLVYRTCSTPACFAPEHIRCAADRRAVTLVLRREGRFGVNAGRKISYRIADEIRERAQRETIEQLCLAYRVGARVVRNALGDRTYIRRGNDTTHDRAA